MRVFPVGKIPVQVLRRVIFRNLGVHSDSLLVGPGIGEDAAVVRMGRTTIVLSTDPITGALANIGWLSVHVNANDVATRGARPRWYFCSVILPEGSGEAVLRKITRQIDAACIELGVTVAGGHSEVTPMLERPLIAGFMVGEVRSGRYVTSSGAVPGDRLILTKSAGIEGTAILATDYEEGLKRHLDMRILRRAQRLYKKISVVEDAMASLEAGGVDAMHDPTEGGLLCGVWELAEASKLGVVLYSKDVPVSPETDAVCRCLGIDPLRLLSSGSLLVAAKPSHSRKIVSRLLRRGIPAVEVGELVSRKYGRRVEAEDGSVVELRPPFPDEIYRSWKWGLGK
ncbi:AIR synthase family protein [Candidatus Bathyarchaeota archaeon]|nr:AIR synthase family protein [Candidatus Bathyarchaeota archaeon]